MSHSKDSGPCLGADSRQVNGAACRMAVTGWTGRGISYRGGLCILSRVHPGNQNIGRLRPLGSWLWSLGDSTYEGPKDQIGT